MLDATRGGRVDGFRFLKSSTGNDVCQRVTGNQAGASTKLPVSGLGAQRLWITALALWPEKWLIRALRSARLYRFAEIGIIITASGTPASGQARKV